MRKAIIMAGLLSGVIAMIGGCDGKQQAPLHERPPPKPPNCPDLPELANLRLKDGRIADVRIFRDGDETFYIPFSWFEWDARQNPGQFARDGTWRSYWDMQRVGYYSYDIHEVECPGVVHEGAFEYTTPFVKIRKYTGDRDIPPNFSADAEIDQVRFYHIHPNRFYPVNPAGNPLVDQDLFLNFQSADVQIRMSKNVMATYQHFPLNEELLASPRGAGPTWEAYKKRAMSTEKWKVWRTSVMDLYQWLKTPPKDRDDDRIFHLGIK